MQASAGLEYPDNFVTPAFAATLCRILPCLHEPKVTSHKLFGIFKGFPQQRLLDYSHTACAVPENYRGERSVPNIGSPAGQARSQAI